MPSKKWQEKAELYRVMAQQVYAGANLDFSPEAARAMYAYESTGKGAPEGLFGNAYNGFFYGKKALDLTLTEWRDGCARGLSFYQELQEDLQKAAETDEDAALIFAWFQTLPPRLFFLSALPSRDLGGQSPRAFMEGVNRQVVRG